MSAQEPGQIQVFGFIKDINESNFFSTHSQSATSQSPHPSKMSSNRMNIIRYRPLAKSIHFESTNLSSSLQRLQQITRQDQFQRINKCKQNLQQAKLIFQNEKQLTHRKQQNYNRLVHCTNILKTRFVSLYETKKHHLNCEKVQIRGRMDKEDWLRRSCDDIRAKKIQRQEGLAEVRMVQELAREQIRRKAEKDRQQTKLRLSKTMTGEQEWRLSKTSSVLESANRFAVRKQSTEKLRRMRSQFHYQVKVRQEQQLIDELNMLRNIEQGSSLLGRDRRVIRSLMDRDSEKWGEGLTQGSGSVFVTQVDVKGNE